jgi:Uri superfamily endonuclease
MQEHMIIPSEPGTYLIVLHLDKMEKLQIGKLGLWEIPEGYYVYVGSARGPGGLAGRLRRHLRPPERKRLHWHIDSLASTADIVQIWWSEDPSSGECRWADRLATIGSRFIPGFGSSDCRCAGHLLRLPSHHTNRVILMEKIGEKLVGIPVHTHPT